MAESQSSYPNGITLRSQASPRPTPPSSSSGFDFHLSIDDLGDEPCKLSSGVQSPLRGRTLQRVHPQSHLVSRATTRRYTNFDPADREWRQRLLSQSFTRMPGEYDPSLLEPLPYERFRSSLSEELHRASTFDSSIDISKFGGHRDTFALLGPHHLRQGRLDLPPMFFAQMAQYLDFDTYKAVRLTCHSWSVATSDARPIKLPPVLMLPAEILENIYVKLSAVDFNAARRACRAWMIIGLEEKLLTLMLKRGGWSGAVVADKEVKAQQDGESRMSVISDNWFLSKRLATECSLGSEWSGHGMSIRTAEKAKSGLQLTSEIDFSQLGTRSSPCIENQSRKIIRFTVSSCSRFLLAFESCDIYIYSLRGFSGDDDIQPYGGHLELLTSILCPGHVLAVSMDTSSQRYAVAALLHGSIGIVCDVDLIDFSAPWLPQVPGKTRSLIYDNGQGSVFLPSRSHAKIDGNDPSYTFATFETIYSTSREREQARAIAAATLPEIHHALHTLRTWASGNDSGRPLPAHTASRTYPLSNSRAENAPRAIYRNLCSVDDPPRSVAICPQRRCVAFGCRNGIEEHWVDALTGQDLSRWFQLSVPSDFLFFMPTREGVDSARKLRLISSAVHPDAAWDTPQSCQNDDRADGHQEQSGLSEHMYKGRSLGLEADPDHFGALPLSDGYHVIFTLPGTGGLCLGRENPSGRNPRNLRRRFMFLGPRNEHGTVIVPGVYAAATELRWGVRVAVAYQDQLWFFVVPPDIFVEYDGVGKKSKASTTSENAPPAPLRIEGVQIATIANLESLAVDGSAGDLTLWAFSANAKACVFQLAGSTSKSGTQRAAMSDGTIVLTRDAEGDTIMTDAPYPSDDPNLHSDGTTSLNEGWPSCLVPCFPTCIHNYCNQLLDAVCSTTMTDANGSPTNPDVQFHATSVHHDLHSSRLPCCPACSHRYCNILLYADSTTLRTDPTPPCIAPSISNTSTNAFVSPASPNSPTNPPFSPSFTPLPEDEGYASAGDEEFEQAGEHFAIYVPPLSGRWSQEDDAEWVPEYLKENGVGIEDEGLGLDVLELYRCECEILGS